MRGPARKAKEKIDYKTLGDIGKGVRLFKFHNKTNHKFKITQIACVFSGELFLVARLHGWQQAKGGRCAEKDCAQGRCCCGRRQEKVALACKR
jgi:hypothetical protein